MKERLKELGMTAWIIILVLFVAVAFTGGRLVYKKHVATYERGLDREIFENSKSHVHSMIEDLGKYKLEYQKSDDEVEKAAIAAYIQENYATFDDNLIDNDTLRTWFNDVMEGNL